MPNKLFYAMLLSTILGVLGGIFFPLQMLSIRWVDTLFINLLKLIATPLIFCAIVTAIFSMGNVKRLRAIWFYTGSYLLVSATFAVSIGFILSNIFKPGQGMSSDIILMYSTPIKLQTEAFSAYFSNYLATLFSSGFINDESIFQIIPIAIASIVFSLACLAVGESARPIMTLFIGLRNVFNKLIVWVMYFTPIGLFSLLGSSIAEAYTKNTLVQSIRGICLFIVTILVGLLCQFLWQLAVIKYITHKNPTKFLKNASSALLTAFATSSSLSTLPMTLWVAKEEKISEEVADFVLPLATTINFTGTAMYEAISALFFCQIMGMNLSIFSQVGIFLTSIIAGLGAGGIPEGGLVTMVIVLRSVNIPTSAIALLLPFDRMLDRLRTALNVWGDLVCAMTVHHFISKSKVSKIKLTVTKTVLMPDSLCLSVPLSKQARTAILR